MADLGFTRFVGYGDSRTQAEQSATVGYCELLEAAIVGVYVGNRGNSGLMLQSMDDLPRYQAQVRDAGVGGPNLITNGAFPADVSGWSQTFGTPVITWESDGPTKVMQVENSATSGQGAGQAFSVSNATNYKLYTKTTRVSGSGNLRTFAGSTSGGLDWAFDNGINTAQHNMSFLTDTTTAHITLANETPTIGYQSYWDNVECRLDVMSFGCTYRGSSYLCGGK
jgi:hypothetical protein